MLINCPRCTLILLHINLFKREVPGEIPLQDLQESLKISFSHKESFEELLLILESKIKGDQEGASSQEMDSHSIEVQEIATDSHIVVTH